MATQVLPLTPDADAYTFRTTLDGQQYAFSLLWNNRDNGWWFVIADSAESAIWSGRLRLGMDLLMYCPDSRRPPGALLAFDPTYTTTDPGPDAGRGELGTRVLLTYVEAVSMAAGTVVVI